MAIASKNDLDLSVDLLTLHIYANYLAFDNSNLCSNPEYSDFEEINKEQKSL